MPLVLHPATGAVWKRTVAAPACGIVSPPTTTSAAITAPPTRRILRTSAPSVRPWTLARVPPTRRTSVGSAPSDHTLVVRTEIGGCSPCIPRSWLTRTKTARRSISGVRTPGQRPAEQALDRGDVGREQLGEPGAGSGVEALVGL